MMATSPLTVLSPLDGRYAEQTAPLAATFSEAALMKTRLHVEVEWFIALTEWIDRSPLRPLETEEIEFLRNLVALFDEAAALKIKALEQEINHDVKAIEYYLKQQLVETSLSSLSEFVHFACTSDDINNLAHALMLKHGVNTVWVEIAQQLISVLDDLAKHYAAMPMLAHTHGQPATPTTVGKEMAVFSYRLQRQLSLVQTQPYLGKINGAVGNFNAHMVAYPDIDWPRLAQAFVEQKLGLVYNPLTTQIESHDYMAELFHTLTRFNTILLDFVCDLWLYISKGYFKEKANATEVGSSTMPHKINPINFENAEGNLHIANSLLNTLAQKLLVSRMQRDLSDSTVIRNIGVAIGHAYLSLLSTLRGIAKLSVNEALLLDELDQTWEVLAEPIQTTMRKNGLQKSYEQLKTLTRGQRITQREIRIFIENLALPDEDKASLLALTPASYIGLAKDLASSTTPD